MSHPEPQQPQPGRSWTPHPSGEAFNPQLVVPDHIAGHSGQSTGFPNGITLRKDDEKLPDLMHTYWIEYHR